MTPPSSTPPPSPFGSAPPPPPASPPSPTPTPAPVLPWYAQTWATVVALVIFPLQPVGVYLMWKYRTWERGPKTLATIVSLLFFVSLLPKSPDKAATRTASTPPSANASARPAAPEKRPAAAPKTASDAAPDAAPAKAPKRSLAKKPVASAPQPQSDPKSLFAQDAQAPPESDEAPAQQASRNVEVLDIPGVGKRDVGIVDEVAYAIIKVEKTPTIGNDFSELRADGQFFVLTLQAHNSAKKTHDVNTQAMELLDDQGREFDPSSQSFMAMAGSRGDSVQLIAQVQPGTTKTLTLVYDAPADASGLQLKIPGSLFSASGEAVLKLPK